MKRRVFYFLILFLSVRIFADSFIDAIQDLAVRTACIGQYSMTEAGGGWYDDPHDYYTPQTIASRLASESGNKTRTLTFYGICFDYADFAHKYIKENERYFQSVGMYERQYWIAGVHGNPGTIILQYPGTLNNYTTIQNGIYVKIPEKGGYKPVVTHNKVTHHAWIWIKRADGVWFWVDPTWTDNTGYVVYGYVHNGEEVQCRPDRKYCVNYVQKLDSLPLPPEMGQNIPSSSTVNSTDREKTIQDATIENITNAIRKAKVTGIDYNMRDEYISLLIATDVPFSSLKEKLSFDKVGIGLEMPLLFNSVAIIVGVEYIQKIEDDDSLYAGIFEFDFTKRLFNNVACYIGGGIGIQNSLSSAYKVDAGLILNISHIFTKVEVSYNNVLGLCVGTSLGIGLDF